MSWTGGRPCTKEHCSKYALPISEPPLCAEHIEDIDLWYHDAWTIAGDERYNLQGDFKYRVVERSVTATLYKEYEQRLSAGTKLGFLFPEIVYWTIATAGSAILGNLAYDDFKALVRKIAAWHSDNELTRLDLDKIIPEERYEELRDISNHITLRSDGVDVEVRAEQRYRVIVKKVAP